VPDSDGTQTEAVRREPSGNCRQLLSAELRNRWARAQPLSIAARDAKSKLLDCGANAIGCVEMQSAIVGEAEVRYA
jgi:hypothetical protein